MTTGTISRGWRAETIAAAAGTVLLLAGCGSAGTDQAPTPAGAGQVQVATSTDVYGDIVHAIGGDKVNVTPIIHTASQDKLAVSKARLLIENGGGYDDFFSTLAEDTTGDHHLLDITRLSGLSPESATAAGDFKEQVQLRRHDSVRGHSVHDTWPASTRQTPRSA